MLVVGADHDALRLGIRVVDAVVIVEIALGIEVGGQLKPLVEHFYAHHAVKAVNSDPVPLRAPAYEIPAVLEELHAVRLHLAALRHGRCVSPVFDLHDAVLLHGREYRREIFAAREDIVHEDAPLQAEILADEVAHGEGVEHPLAQAVALYIVGIVDEVTVVVGAVAGYLDAEGEEHLVAPAVERGPRQPLVVAHILVVAVDLRQLPERQPPMAADSINQPYVFLYPVHCEGIEELEIRGEELGVRN